MSAFGRELDVARTTALEAAALVRRYRGSDVAVDRKTDDSPVTEADRAASELIVQHLRAAFPADAILSEEVPDDLSRIGSARVWMIDPIDGTRDFIRGETGFAVMIGLAVDGRPQVGVVAQPATGKTYLGEVGSGAWLEATGEERAPLRTSTTSGPPIRLVASKSHRTPKIDAIRAALSITDEINVGSVGLKIGLVAEAVRDLYVYPGGQTKLWDTCGPEAILVASGGCMTDLDGAPLVYTVPDLRNARGIIASNGPLHPFVVERLATLPSLREPPS